MNGRVAKKIRREVFGQGFPHTKKYIQRTDSEKRYHLAKLAYKKLKSTSITRASFMLKLTRNWPLRPGWTLAAGRKQQPKSIKEQLA